VVVAGDLDGDTAPELDQALDRLLPELPVLIDLAGLTLLTSVGVRALLKQRQFGRPAIFCPEGVASKVLDIIEARRVVPIYGDLEAALEGLGSGSRR
jgi:STAS domain